MAAAQMVEFRCTGGDIATPSTGFAIYRGEEAIYNTGVVVDGFQNSEFGYMAARDSALFTKIFRGDPEALLEPPIPPRD